MATVTLTLSEEAATELERRATQRGVQPSDVVNSLLLLEVADFTAEELFLIQEGEAEADAGFFASPEELEAMLSRYRDLA